MKTISKSDMIQINRSDLGEWVSQLKESPEKLLRIGDMPLNYTLMTSQELHTLYDPNKATRVSVNGMSRELRRAGFRKLFGGDLVYTKQGNQRLWAVRDIEKYSNPQLTKSKVADIYDAERSNLPDEKEKRY